MRILFSEYQEKRSEREKKRAKRVATPNGGEKLERKFKVNEKWKVSEIFFKDGFYKDPAMQILKTNIHGTLLFQ